MSNNMTTTRSGFRVEDVTFKRARRQSDIEKEIAEEQGDVYVPEKVKPPVSMTPEQIKDFLHLKIDTVSDTNEKRLYGCCIQYIDRALEAEKRLVEIELKQKTEVDENADE